MATLPSVEHFYGGSCHTHIKDMLDENEENREPFPNDFSQEIISLQSHNFTKGREYKTPVLALKKQVRYKVGKCMHDKGVYL